MAESGLTKQRVVAQLMRSTHGALAEYIPITRQVAKEDPEFLAHLISFNDLRGQVRDSKIALPVGSMVPGFDFSENSLAHLAKLDPRNLVRALRFAEEVKAHGRRRGPKAKLTKLVERYLRVREAHPAWWDAVTLQHRASMKTLYSLRRVKPSAHAERILFQRDYPAASVFRAVADLSKMSAAEQAATIIQKRIPFLVVVSALGAKAKDPDLVLAIISQMSPAEIVTNMKLLERLGVNDTPALRGALEEALGKVAKGDKTGQVTFKTSKAANAVADKKLKAKLHGTQEKQVQRMSVDGDWLVLGDKSSSMVESMEAAKLVAATLAKVVSGEVRLVFFNTAPQNFDVSGKTFDEVKVMTQYVRAGGATSIGCGLKHALGTGFEPGGIAIVSDGAENTPPYFVDQYDGMVKKLEKDVPVYLYWVKCDSPNPLNNDPDRLRASMEKLGHEVEVFDIRQGIDFYSLPNIVQTMRANRYSLIDEIMAVPLLTLDEVFQQQAKAHVLAR